MHPIRINLCIPKVLLPTIRKFAKAFLLVLLVLTLGLETRAEAQRTVSLVSTQTTVLQGIELVSVGDGFESPTYVTHAGDGSGRLFVVEQPGSIQIIHSNGSLGSAPFLDINSRVRSPTNGGGSEEGLLSVAFPPDYAVKGYFYVYYTNLDGNNVLARYYLTSDPDVANPASEEIILLFDHPNHTNHNGGQLVFGPDGYLYIGTGDGGGGGDPQENAQDLGSLLGKILRIDVEIGAEPPSPAGEHVVYLPVIYKSGNSPPYKIPADNPFVDTPGARPEIWAYGLRNPWRFSFDRQNGDLYIGDVGQNNWEEIDYQPAASPGGENYGWDYFEGTHDFEGTPPPDLTFTWPIHEYSQSNGHCSVTGGYVYRGSAIPDLQGTYIYGDFCSGVIWGLKRVNGIWQNQLLIDSDLRITSFGEDESGELYVVDRGGEIFRIESTAN